MAPASILLVESLAHRRVAFAQEAHVYRQSFGRLQHLVNIPSACGDSGAVGAVGWAYAAAYKGSNTVAEAVIGLLWRNKMHVTVDTGRGKDKVLA